ncbi:HAD family hydrolase [Leptolyngbya sp. FACHB-321]|uniref:D-glycero-alpha-D-manno-heptose-1,7-bisphosphate 7-phosphatase n=1 Tax=Leptolyngbya sp. FACHB-321 TaxID=2692807 RepID=UPI00168693AE|nr:HAD family hydrolase [Leptolyngbya sp. FACHB-321]MBD2034645.1 HAD family hydrolase [Leptolyngbya sp. FACHB-321]
MKHRAVFLDKDGTLIEDVPYNVDPAQMRLTVGAGVGLEQMHQMGYQLIVISNQSGVARGYFPESALAAVEQRLHALLKPFNVSLAGFYYCPHHPEGTVAEYAIACACRKPAPGLLIQAARDHAIDLTASWFIGDILNDVEAGRSAGCQTILLNNGNETEWLRSADREPHYITMDLAEAAAIIGKAEGGGQRADFPERQAMGGRGQKAKG